MNKKICTICKQEKNEIEFYKKKGRDKRDSLCRSCLYEIQKKRWIDRKKKAISLFGGKCIKCGYNKNYAALEFHHIDPETKDFDWSKLRLRSWESVISELKKCILICSNCHKEEHYPDCDNLEENGKANTYLNIEIKSTGICPTCNNSVFGTKYCSVQCSSLGNRKVDRPTKEQLLKLVEVYPITQIAKKYNVSDTAIRKWLKFYGG